MSTTIIIPQVNAGPVLDSSADISVTSAPVAFALDAVIRCTIANHASVSPIKPCRAMVEFTANSGVTWEAAQIQWGDSGNNVISHQIFSLSDYAGLGAWTHFRVVMGGNRGSACTVSAVVDSGSLSTPPSVTVTDMLDAAFGDDQGMLLYRGSTAWVALTPGTASQVLTTGGIGANVVWASTGAGSPIADDSLLANISGVSAIPTAHTVSEVLDAVIGPTQGIIASRGASIWVPAPGMTFGTSGETIRPATTVATPVAGSEWYSSTTKTMRRCRNVNGANQLVETGGGTIYQCGSCDAYGNSSTLSTVLANPISARGSLIIPANSLSAGATLSLKAWGKYSTAATGPTLIWKVLLGGTVLASSTAVTQASNQTNSLMITSNPISIMFATVGAAANVYAFGTLAQYQSGTSAFSNLLTPNGFGAVGAVTVDTTTDLALDLQAQWNTISTSNTLQVLGFEVLLNG